MQQSDNILFSGGMNTDDDPRMMDKGDYLEARNVRIGSTQEQGDDGLVQTIKSTLKINIETSIPNLGVIEYYGSAVDEETKTAYILAITKHENDTNAYFTIFKHNLITNAVSIILRQTALSWGMKLWDSDMQKCYNPVIVDHNLIWTDNVNDIRMINVLRAENSYTSGINIARPFSQTFCLDPGYELGDLVIYSGYTYKANRQTFGEYHSPDYVGGYFDIYPNDVVEVWDSLHNRYVGYKIGAIFYFKDLVYKVIQETHNVPEEVVLDVSNNYIVPLCKIVDCYFDTRNPNNFTLASLPPLIAPTVEYATDESILINRLRGNTFQFTYRYIYFDWRKSTYAPPSIVAPPSKEENTEGKPNTNPALNNRLDITVNSGKDDVRIIEVVARDSSDLAAWYKISEIKIINDLGWKMFPSNSDIDVNFYNNIAKIQVDTTLIYTPFSFIPIKAKHMEVLERNILSFANITEGYGYIDSSIAVNTSWSNVTGVSTQTYTFDVLYDISDLSGGFETYRLKVVLPLYGLGSPGVFKLELTDAGVTKVVEYTYNGTDPYPSTVVTGLRAAVVAEFGSGALNDCYVRDQNMFCILPGYAIVPAHGPYFNRVNRKGLFVQNIVSDVDKYPMLSTGFVHSWGIVYRDIVGRLSPVIGNDLMTKYIPFITESASTTTGSIPSITFDISHKPPVWADSYEIVYSGNKSSDWFLFLIGYNFTNGKKTHTDPMDLGGHSDNQNYRIRLSAAQSNTRTFYNNWLVEEYVWQKGDRIRIIGTITRSGVLTKINTGVWDTEITGSFVDSDFPDLTEYSVGYTRISNVIIVDTVSIPHLYYVGQEIYLNFTSGSATDGTYTVTEVINDYVFRVPSLGSNTSGNVTIFPGEKSDDTWLYFKKSKTLTLNPSSPPLDGLYFQIYRSKSTFDTTLFFSTGMTFNISTDDYGNKYHEGNTNQVLNSNGDNVTPATVNNLSHDAWKYIRNFRNENNAVTIFLFTESQFCSDWYITQSLTSSGIPIQTSEFQKQNFIPNRIRHGNNLNIGTQINNISKFDPLDFVDLKDEDGPIEGLRNVGFTLKVIQKTKVTSIFIGRTESYNANGSPDYQFTNKVFGGVRPSEENWGTSHPDSVIVNGRNIYYWDQSQGVVVRDAPNGSFPISNYKMKRYFADLARVLDAENKEDQRVNFAFSIETDELFCMFGIADTAKQIVSFNEKDSRWKEIIDISFAKGLFYWLGKRLFHASSNFIYEWWMGSDYQNISGTPVNGSIAFYSVGSPIKPKIFNSIIIYQTGGTPEIGSVVVPAKATSVESEMLTYVYPQNITKKEGVYYCGINRDVNDPRPLTANEKLVNGRLLRGLYAKIVILFTGTTKKTLSNVSVLSTPSERSL